MNNNSQRLILVYLKPTELAMAERPSLISTILGSCVAVTLFSPQSGIGAICHAMLPTGGAPTPFKFVDGALGHMLQWFSEKGVFHRELEAKLFGGADMFTGPTILDRQISVGHQNIQMALRLLTQAHIRLIAQDVGGCTGRKILFRTNTGEVLLKRLGGQNLSPAGGFNSR